MTTSSELPVLPALVDGVVTHRRPGPVAYAFRHKAYQWLVDLDELPRLPWYLRPFAGFDARDHPFGPVGSSAGDIRGNVLRFLADNDIELGPAGRVVMLANARVLGHVFDPLSVFWCFGSDGSLRCLIAEVHNTYRQRHAYLLTPDANGDAAAGKRLYVSPFNDVSGRYRMHFGLTNDRLAVRIALERDDQPRFDATFTGAVRPATRGTIARLAARRPAMPQRVSLLIRFHGIRLWLKGLTVAPRPAPPPEDGSADESSGAAAVRTSATALPVGAGGCPVGAGRVRG